MTRELVPVNETAARRHLRLGMFGMGGILGLSRVDGITPAQLQLGCLPAVMLQLNCLILGLLWPIDKKSNHHPNKTDE